MTPGEHNMSIWQLVLLESFWDGGFRENDRTPSRQAAKPPSRKNNRAENSLVQDADLRTFSFHRSRHHTMDTIFFLRIVIFAAWRENLRFLLQTTSTRRG
jgi:hypothetical protein